MQNSEKFVAKNAQMLNGQISHNSVLLPILSRTNQPTFQSIEKFALKTVTGIPRALPISPSQITFLCHKHLGLHRLDALYPLQPQESRHRVEQERGPSQ